MSAVFTEFERLTAEPEPFSESDLGRLAVLRHQTGVERVATATGPPEPPPPPGTDLFSGVEGLPEVSGRDLTATHVASGLRCHGALLVRQLVTADDVAQLTSRLDDTDWKMPLQPAGTDGEPLEGSAPMKCSVGMLKALIDVYNRAGMRNVMTDYLGEAPVLLAERLEVNRQMVSSGLRWHQDGTFFGGTFGAVNTWLALSRCGTDATGLSVVSRRISNLICEPPEGQAPSLEDKYLDNEAVAELAGPHGVNTPDLEPGDAILLDEHTLHRTAIPPPDPAPRTWAVGWFFAPSRFPAHRHPLHFG